MHEVPMSNPGRHQIPELQIIRHGRQAYIDSVEEQERLVDEIIHHRSKPCIILTEHDPVYTIGTSGSENDILHTVVDGERIAVMSTGRGGEVTYHGPGQIVCYVLADLRQGKGLAPTCLASGGIDHPEPWMDSISGQAAINAA